MMMNQQVGVMASINKGPNGKWRAQYYDAAGWCAQLKADGYEQSYVYALHARLSQILSDAVHDGILARNPCSRRTSPGAGKQKPYCATTEQVWALYDAFPEHLKPAILLGAFVGLRTAEACGARTEDMDFMRGVFPLPCNGWPSRSRPRRPRRPCRSRPSCRSSSRPRSLAGGVSGS